MFDRIQALHVLLMFLEASCLRSVLKNKYAQVKYNVVKSPQNYQEQPKNSQKIGFA